MGAAKQEYSVVAIFDSRIGAEGAVKTLESSGLDGRRLWIVAKDSHTEDRGRGFYTLADRMKFWAARGAFWGTLFGTLLSGVALSFAPAVGPPSLMTPLIGWIAGALFGAALGVLAAALTNRRPKSSAGGNELDVKAGGFLLLAYASAESIQHARVLLGTSEADEANAHAA